MKFANSLVVCINPLHYLQSNTYDIIVLDELETTLNKLYSNKHYLINLIRHLKVGNVSNELLKMQVK